MLGLSFLIISLATGCGGTKVYNNNKTVVYRDSIFNITDVVQINSTIEGRLSDDSTVNLSRVERKQFENYLEQGGSVFVRMVINLDDQELVYAAQSVDSWRDYNRLLDRFERAGEDIADLLKDKKDTQIELR